MISKELLSEVLDKPITKIQKADNTLIAYWDIYSAQHSLINIHELAFKCKEWAVYKGYTVVEAPLMIRITRLGTEQNKIWEYTDEEQNNQEYFKPEYTFKACEWILNNATN